MKRDVAEPFPATAHSITPLPREGIFKTQKHINTKS